MCRYTTLVWLGVLAFVAHGDKKTVIGPTTPKSLVNTMDKAFDFSDMTWVTSSLPSSDWNVAGWVNIQIFPDHWGIFVVVVPTVLWISWPSNSGPYFSDSTETVYFNENLGNRPVGKWVHMVLGCDTSLIYFIITRRTSTTSQSYGTYPLIYAVGTSFQAPGAAKKGK